TTAADVAERCRRSPGPGILAATIAKSAPHAHVVNLIHFERLQLDALPDPGLRKHAYAVQRSPFGQHGVVTSQPAGAEDPTRSRDRGLDDLPLVEHFSDAGLGRFTW